MNGSHTFIIIGQYIVRINYYIWHQSFYLNRDSLFLVSMISCLLGRWSGVIMLFRFLIRGVTLVPDAANCSTHSFSPLILALPQIVLKLCSKRS